MQENLVRDLLGAGFHFGHPTSRWNPKMKPYIFGKKNLIHLIDIKETIKGLIIAQKFVEKVCGQGKTVLFVGTKHQARSVVEEAANRCGMPYVSERWLGGTLTNFQTIISRVARLEEVQQMEEDGTLESMTKKEISMFMREKEKLVQNLEGIRTMKTLPGALIIIDSKRERIAVAEANRLDIPVVALTDTDCDPTVVDVVIPGNDDAIRAIEIVCARMADAALAGKARAAQAPPPRPHKPAKQPEPPKTEDQTLGEPVAAEGVDLGPAKKAKVAHQESAVPTEETAQAPPAAAEPKAEPPAEKSEEQETSEDKREESQEQ